MSTLSTSIRPSVSLSVLPARGNDLITNSRRQCTQDCNKKSYYRYELGIRHEVTAKPLRLGSAYHLGIERHNKGDSQADATIKALAGYEELPQWCRDSEAADAWYREREIVARMLTGYWWRFSELDKDIKIIASELPFEIPLINPETGRASTNYKLAGKIDEIVQLPDNRLAIRETKTTGDSIKPDSPYWSRLRIDSQISTYYYAARSLGYDVATCIYNVARKPATKPSKLTMAETKAFLASGEYCGETFKIEYAASGAGVKVNGVTAEVEQLKSGIAIRETIQMWGARFTSDIMAKPDEYFWRQEIPRLQSDLDEFAAEMWDFQKILTDMRNHNRFPRNSRQCNLMGSCEYIPLCYNGFNPAADGEQPTPLPAGLIYVDDLHPELQGDVE